jgi:hypothetical protein
MADGDAHRARRPVLQVVDRTIDHHEHWHLRRTCLNRLVMDAIDRYGHVALCRDMSELSRCNRKCQVAKEFDCSCS